MLDPAPVVVRLFPVLSKGPPVAQIHGRQSRKSFAFTRWTFSSDLGDDGTDGAYCCSGDMQRCHDSAQVPQGKEEKPELTNRLTGTHMSELRRCCACECRYHLGFSSALPVASDRQYRDCLDVRVIEPST